MPRIGSERDGINCQARVRHVRGETVLKIRKLQRVIVVGTIGMGLAGSVIAPGSAQAAAGCRSGNPLANVWSPGRLKVLSSCKTVSGTIVASDVQADGDGHYYLRADKPYAGLLNKTNKAVHGGTLILEIVPADQPGCTKGHPVKDGICTGAHLAKPGIGQHVTVTGPYTWDSFHGWNEIHPVWSIH